MVAAPAVRRKRRAPPRARRLTPSPEVLLTEHGVELLLTPLGVTFVLIAVAARPRVGIRVVGPCVLRVLLAIRLFAASHYLDRSRSGENETSSDTIPRLGEVLNSFLVTRRPVFDRGLDLTAYELLVGGGGDGDASANNDTGDHVSSLVLEVASEGEISSILGEHPAWLTLSVPVAREAAGASLGKKRTTIELRLEGRESGEVRGAIDGLKTRGHTVAIGTDAQGNGSAAELLQAADIAAVDVAGMNASQMEAVVEKLKPARVAAAATNIDAPERQEEAHAAGFDLFRGEFFKKPRSRS